MPDWLPVALPIVGMVFVALITFFGTRYAARQSARAAERTAATSSRQVDVGEWQAIVEALRAEVERLGTRVQHLEDSQRVDRADTRQLLAFARSLIAIIYRIAPDHPIPSPPTAFVDELTYITERPRA